MNREMELYQKIADLEQKLIRQAAANNFVITHIVKILDDTSDEVKFSSKLKEILTESLSKINDPRSLMKASINDLMQPSIQILGRPPEKFIK
ncbi:hypothetical protein [Serratia sp. JSRIV004]|uniref:hypothetical protein n=1 Tax=Serratia sp. JSRIV004 TaxID=2831895 RepID=UPI001CBCC916|nr:hypothetical protein [Serratia sp. JSRIV004]UAN55340.1 hypothetical protein KGP21_16685 [Serratia sp. JSRIV004]